MRTRYLYILLLLLLSAPASPFLWGQSPPPAPASQPADTPAWPAPSGGNAPATAEKKAPSSPAARPVTQPATPAPSTPVTPAGKDNRSNGVTEKKKAEPTPKEKDEALAGRIEQTLEYGIQKDRKEAINSILKIKDPDVRARLEKKLIEILRTDTDPEVLIRALSVTGELKIKAAADVIVPHINHDSEDVRIAAVYALRDIGAIDKKDILIAKLKEQDMAVDSNFTEALIVTLGDFKASELIPWAKEKIENIKTGKIGRTALLLFLGKTGNGELKDFLLKLYKDENEDMTIRSYAVNALGKLGIKEAAPDIRALLTEIDSYPFKKKKTYHALYLYSIVALVKMGDTEAIPRIMDALKSNNVGVRLKAIELIKEFNDKRTIDILQYKMKYDPEPRVQSAARKALKELGVETGDEPKPAAGTDQEDEEKKKKEDEQ